MPSIFIDRDKVVSLLIRERCKLADKQSQIDQVNDFIDKRDCYRKGNKYSENTLYKLFPSRKEWCHLGDNEKRKKLSSIKRNELILLYTYLRAKHKKSTDKWYKDLCSYADDIVNIALNLPDKIDPPTVTVIEKKRKNDVIIFRPVCTFPLKYKIIFSLLNKYLTEKFDKLFYDCSYAFRSTQKKYKYGLKHLNAVYAVQQYRKKHIGKSLYVAECDMQKFYDTIDHVVIKTRFQILLYSAIDKHYLSYNEAELIKKIFFLYIDCFDFKKDVFTNNSKPSDDPFWRKSKKDILLKCKIEWVEKLEETTDDIEVGVPQGGPLSGLVANIVMHFVDDAVCKYIGKKDVLYARFCDDMVLIGTEKDFTLETLKIYQKAICDSKLYAHQKENVGGDDFRMRKFWDGKTRGPYEWNEKGENVFPWITFVGFDINWQGNLRIRRGSYRKQIAKQYTIAYDLLHPYLRGKNPGYSKGTVKSSLVSRLICMSVGRVNLRNYRNHDNNCSWMSAFSILDNNKWSVNQMKGLDRHRNLIIRRAFKLMDNFNYNQKIKKTDEEKYENRYLYYGCPYSYYGQCFIYKYVSKEI